MTLFCVVSADFSGFPELGQGPNLWNVFFFRFQELQVGVTVPLLFDGDGGKQSGARTLRSALGEWTLLPASPGRVFGSSRATSLFSSRAVRTLPSLGGLVHPCRSIGFDGF